MTRTALVARGLRLEYATLGWNVVGTIVVVAAAIVAHSVALIGFGIDSLIEIFASVVVVWQLKDVGRDREAPALRLIGAAFFALAAYVLAQAIRVLALAAHPQTSLLGIAWLAATFVAMLLLAWGKQTTGRQLNNPVLTTEAHVTLVDAYLAGAVLVGLLLNAMVGWWWADPAAGLVIVYYGIREGREAFAYRGALQRSTPATSFPDSGGDTRS
jgi:divalent metal cation (Fe/Co/Zn/Cd) transporter